LATPGGGRRMVDDLQTPYVDYIIRSMTEWFGVRTLERKPTKDLRS